MALPLSRPRCIGTRNDRSCLAQQSAVKRIVQHVQPASAGIDTLKCVTADGVGIRARKCSFRLTCCCSTNDDGTDEASADAAAWPADCQSIGRALLGLTTAFMFMSFATPALAETHGWRPRRHHRRMGEPRPELRIVYNQSNGGDGDETESSTWHAKVNAIQERVAEALAPSSVIEMTVSAPRSSSMHYVQPRAPPVQAVREGGTTMAWVGAGVAAAVAAYFGIRAFMQQQRREANGVRVVRDRSLGGREVVIPEAASPRQRSPYSRDIEELVAAAARRAPTASARSTESTASQSVDDTGPSWWQEPMAVGYVPNAVQENAQRSANRILRQLEDSKLLGGADYSVPSLIQLYNVCREGNITVKPSTESGRDNMYRAAVRAAVQSAQRGSASLGQLSARQFVCGFAPVLGISKTAAVNIVEGAVASTIRSSLLQMVASQRAGREDVLDEALKLAALLDVFPLPRGAAQNELIAAGLSQHSQVHEREIIFRLFAQLSAKHAAAMAEMLAFDPDVVVPQVLGNDPATSQNTLL